MEDDFVEYFIYPMALQEQSQNENMIKLRAQCFDVLEKFVNQYMWHQDSFVLNVQDAQKLHGKVIIGDNVEDEWYIISLLFYLSEKLPVVIQVHDQDGEILLIESADYLPKWAQEPELAQNRVYIYQGNVHLIPIAQSPAELTPIPSGKN